MLNKLISKAQWDNLSPRFKEMITYGLRGKPYFPVENFGSEYHISPNRIARIRELECHILQSASEAAGHLENSAIEARKEQLRQNRPIRWSYINRLFYGQNNNPKLFESVNVSNICPKKLGAVFEKNSDLLAAAASARGRRKTLEDCHIIATVGVTIGDKVKKAAITAIFDGRGGEECSSFVANNFTSRFKYYLENLNYRELADIGVINALSLTFVDLSHKYNRQNASNATTGYNIDAGCTANAAVRIDDTLWIANTGDSRALLVDASGKARQLSKDIGPFDRRRALRKTEGARFFFSRFLPYNNFVRAARGGALGEHWANGRISSRPEITKIVGERLQGSFLIQTCDGITDVASSEAIAARFTANKNYTLLDSATDLVKAAYARGSADNLTVLIRSFKDS